MQEPTVLNLTLLLLYCWFAWLRFVYQLRNGNYHRPAVRNSITTHHYSHRNQLPRKYSPLSETKNPIESNWWMIVLVLERIQVGEILEGSKISTCQLYRNSVQIIQWVFPLDFCVKFKIKFLRRRKHYLILFKRQAKYHSSTHPLHLFLSRQVFLLNSLACS